MEWFPLIICNSLLKHICKKKPPDKDTSINITSLQLPNKYYLLNVTMLPNKYLLLHETENTIFNIHKFSYTP